jgi:sortase (surface protein transpeptidase)
MRGHRMRFAVAMAALGAVLVTGCGTSGDSQPVSGAPTSEQLAPPVEAVAEPAEPAEIAEPSEIEIPRIGAHSTLVGLNLNDNDTVEVPPVTEPMQAGWFTGGPKPGEPGPAVILGHVNGNGHPGIFAKLHELKPGDEIVISKTDGSKGKFVVRKVEQIAKNQFPTEAVYGDTSGPELRLITCGGTFDKAARSYRDNVIVYAS